MEQIRQSIFPGEKKNPSKIKKWGLAANILIYFCSHYRNNDLYFGKQVPCMLMDGLEKVHAGADG